MQFHAPLIIDVAGHRLSPVDRQRLAHPLVGGVILFGRNWKDRAQLTALCRQIKAVRADLLIAVDHEGGRVQRFRTGGFTHLPPMAAFGARWMRAASAAREGEAALQAMNAATAAGYVLGAELRACGVDLSFAPVLDLDYGESSVIGDRAFGRDPRVVTLLAQSLMQGMLQSGMAHCGKHFPGHGFVQADSHLAVPVDTRSLSAILSEDAAPYGWLSASLRAVMPAHVIYSRVDARPAGFSRRWLQDVLRLRLGFTGAIFSDDLSMAAARQIDGRAVSFTTAALAALHAGCDMVLLCNQSVVDEGSPIDDAIDSLSRAALEGIWQPEPASEERRLALLPAGAPLDWDALMVSARYMQALSLLPDSD
ncbi:beta-N-acetylhexosaminidase [Hydrogenophaga sp.]|uniref:beta-N-acetylhexosaminidase n=1 Tax=Hydrogenophaga sp. TaxID=1904254 RepID=UPI00262B973E|nr:beta-N-acetylhexosaminidase [Hydrogenophaga sp.]MCW5653253.1 beta-N-acetylhexosaminidase [Hydrogenophaga sp.]